MFDTNDDDDVYSYIALATYSLYVLYFLPLDLVHSKSHKIIKCIK